MGYRRPGQTAILPPPKVVRCLMPPLSPRSLPPLMITAQGGPPLLPLSLRLCLQPRFHVEVLMLKLIYGTPSSYVATGGKISPQLGIFASLKIWL